MTGEYTADAPGRLTTVQHGLDAFIPAELPPAVEAEPLLSPLSNAAGALGHFRASVPQPLPEAVASRYLLFQEAVASSRIEHLDVTLQQLYAYRSGNRNYLPEGQRRDVETVSNYVDAFEFGRAETPVSVDTLCGLHERLLGGVADDKHPGDLRKAQNYIGGRYGKPTYVPPPPEHVAPLLQQAVAFTRGDPCYAELIDAALTHYQFEAIHPFLDGNGRTGRLWFLHELHGCGALTGWTLPVSQCILANRDRYTDWLLAVSQTGAWTEWLTFMLEMVETQAVESRETLGRLAARYEEVTSLYSDREASAQSLSQLLFETPVFSVRDYVEESEFAYTTVNRTVDRFRDDGLVREVTNGNRNRVFVATWLDDFGW